MTAPTTFVGPDPADSRQNGVRMIHYTNLEWVELGDAYAAHDQASVADINHVAQEREEIERLTAEGRYP